MSPISKSGGFTYWGNEILELQSFPQEVKPDFYSNPELPQISTLHLRLLQISNYPASWIAPNLRIPCISDCPKSQITLHLRLPQISNYPASRIAPNLRLP